MRKFFVLSLLLSTLSLLLTLSSLAEEIRVTEIESKRDRGFDYLDIYTTGWSEARGLLLEDKLYIDFPGARIGKDIKIMRKKSSRIRSIQAVQKDQKTARIIISLKREVEYDIVNVFGKNKSVVEIGDRTTNIYAHQFAWESKEIKKKARPLKPVRLAPIVSEKTLSLKGKKIILDPGHGGEDPGAFTSDGQPEKILTLQTARETARLLREEGAIVYLTRDEDRRSNLQDVAEFANKTGADIFISIHYNSIDNSNISGTETYYYNPISRNFAAIMHEAIVRGIKRKDHGMHRTPFYVVKNTNVPSVLLEPVYISNPEESYLAKAASFQQELAESILKGVKSYFRSKPD